MSESSHQSEDSKMLGQIFKQGSRRLGEELLVEDEVSPLVLPSKGRRLGGLNGSNLFFPANEYDFIMNNSDEELRVAGSLQSSPEQQQ